MNMNEEKVEILHNYFMEKFPDGEVTIDEEFDSNSAKIVIILDGVRQNTLYISSDVMFENEDYIRERLEKYNSVSYILNESGKNYLLKDHGIVLK